MLDRSPDRSPPVYTFGLLLILTAVAMDQDKTGERMKDEMSTGRAIFESERVKKGHALASLHLHE